MGKFVIPKLIDTELHPDPRGRHRSRMVTRDAHRIRHQFRPRAGRSGDAAGRHELPVDDSAQEWLGNDHRPAPGFESDSGLCEYAEGVPGKLEHVGRNPHPGLVVVAASAPLAAPRRCAAGPQRRATR